jgi:LEA14-like dessication related protein
MMKLFYAFSLFIVLSSCATFQEPEFRKMDDVHLGKIDGKAINFTVDATVFNPNWYALKVKKSNVDVFLEGQKIGILYLDEKVKMKGKSESSLSVPMRIVLEDGAMITLMRYALKKDVQLRLTGKIKGGIFFISKKFPVDEQRSVSGKDLRIVLP